MSPLLALYLDQFLIFVLVLTRVGCLLMALPVSAALLVGLRHLRRAYEASPVFQDDPD